GRSVVSPCRSPRLWRRRGCARGCWAPRSASRLSRSPERRSRASPSGSNTAVRAVRALKGGLGTALPLRVVIAEPTVSAWGRPTDHTHVLVTRSHQPQYHLLHPVPAAARVLRARGA